MSGARRNIDNHNPDEDTPGGPEGSPSSRVNLEAQSSQDRLFDLDIDFDESESGDAPLPSKPPAKAPPPPMSRSLGVRYQAQAPPPPTYRRSGPSTMGGVGGHTLPPPPRRGTTTSPGLEADEEDLAAAFASSDPTAFGVELGQEDVPEVVVDDDPWAGLGDDPEPDPWADLSDDVALVKEPVRETLMLGDAALSFLVGRDNVNADPRVTIPLNQDSEAFRGNYDVSSDFDDLALLGFSAKEVEVSPIDHNLPEVESLGPLSFGNLSVSGLVEDVSVDLSELPSRFETVSLDIDGDGDFEVGEIAKLPSQDGSSTMPASRGSALEASDEHASTTNDVSSALLGVISINELFMEDEPTVMLDGTAAPSVSRRAGRSAPPEASFGGATPLIGLTAPDDATEPKLATSPNLSLSSFNTFLVKDISKPQEEDPDDDVMGDLDIELPPWARFSGSEIDISQHLEDPHDALTVDRPIEDLLPDYGDIDPTRPPEVDARRLLGASDNNKTRPAPAEGQPLVWATTRPAPDVAASLTSDEVTAKPSAAIPPVGEDSTPSVHLSVTSPGPAGLSGAVSKAPSEPPLFQGRTAGEPSELPEEEDFFLDDLDMMFGESDEEEPAVIGAAEASEGEEDEQGDEDEGDEEEQEDEEDDELDFLFGAEPVASPADQVVEKVPTTEDEPSVDELPVPVLSPRRSAEMAFSPPMAEPLFGVALSPPQSRPSSRVAQETPQLDRKADAPPPPADSKAMRFGILKRTSARLKSDAQLKAVQPAQIPSTDRRVPTPSGFLSGFDTPMPFQVEQHGDDLEALLNEAHNMRRLSRFEEAQKALDKLLKLEPAHEEVLDLVRRNRVALKEHFLKKLGDLDDTPRILISPDAMMEMGIDSRGGYLLSQIDGVSTFRDLIELSPMDSTDSARMLAWFMDAGIIGAR